jgi:hypothetical protein
MIMPITYLLANVLPDPSSASALGWLVLTAAGAALAANQLLGAVITVRKLRGNDPETDARYATKHEITNIATDVAALEGRIDQVNKTLSTELRDIHRALGRIEGALGTEPRG